MSNFIDLTTIGVRSPIFRVSPLSLEEKVRWAFLWRIIVASRCFNFYVKILISGFSRSKTVRSILFLGLKMEILGGGGSWQPKKKPFRIAKNANNRNIATGQAEFIAGDWITWWRFKFRLYAKKILSNLLFKSFETFQKIFSFSKIEKSEISKSERYFLKMENIPKAKIENFQIFRLWKMKIFSEKFQNF